MKTLSRLLAAIVGIAGTISTAAAAPAYSNGDLLLGVRATVDPGTNQDYVINIGPASQYLQATESFTVTGLGNILTDLANFSDSGVADWNARAEVQWGIAGTDLAGDPANTLYATKPRSNPATQTVSWDRRANGSQSTTNSTIRAFISGFTNSDSNAASAKGTLQSSSALNRYSQFTSPGVDFGYFSGIEGNFGNGTAGSVLDLYRLTPTSQAEGVRYVGSFQFNNSGVLTFTPPAPTAPTFKFSSATYTVNEDGGTVAVRVIRGGLTTGADTVTFNTSDATALAGTDYTAKTAFSVNFAANETQADVLVNITNITGVQSSRTFNVALSSPSAGTLVSPNTAVVTINDSTPQNYGQIAFSAATYSFAPVNSFAAPNQLSVTLTRTNGSDRAVSADVSIAGGGSLVNGTDFANIASPTTVSFAAGETSKAFLIQLNALADSKLPGTINLSLSNAQGGATLGSTVASVITVTAKDKELPTFTLTSKSGKVTNGAFQIAGSARDNADIHRVEVRVNGGAAQLATLGALTAGSRSIDLSGLALENGKNTIVVTAFDTSGNPAKSITLKVEFANSRPALVGSYNGLATAVSSPVNNTTGFVTAKVTALGAFTGKVTIGAAVLPIKGVFDNAGAAHFNVTAETATAPTSLALSKKIGATTVQFGALALNISTDEINGTLKDGATVLATIATDRAAFDGKTPATTVDARYLANKGAYTVVFPARTSQVGLTAAQFPQGDGFATLKLTNKGVVTLKGVLADGTKLSAAAPLSKTYEWPLFAKLYKKQGAIAAPVTFDDAQTDSDLKGANVVWIRPADPKAKHYPAGWPASILTDLLGSKFAPLAGTLRGVGAENPATGNANLSFSDGKLPASPLVHTVNISPATKVTNAPATKDFSLSIAAKTGLFKGKFKHSDNSSPAFSGVVFQKAGANDGGYGFFLSTVPKGGPSGESGAVTLEAK